MIASILDNLRGFASMKTKQNTSLDMNLCMDTKNMCVKTRLDYMLIFCSSFIDAILHTSVCEGGGLTYI